LISQETPSEKISQVYNYYKYIIFFLSDAVGVDIMITIKIDSLRLSSSNKKDLVIEFLHFIIATDVLYKMA